MLSAGTTYWINATPTCALCGGRAFESNVPTPPGANRVGPADDLDASYFNSTSFGASFDNANHWGGFRLFSFGVVGTLANGTLTVTKQVQSNSQDPGRWDLNIDGTDTRPVSATAARRAR